MVSLLNGGLSDGNLNKRPLENGYCSTSSGGVPLKYKPRKVSAVRDFPPGCGRNAPRINLRPQETAVVSVGDKTADVVEVNGVKNSEIGVEYASHEVVKSPVRRELADSLDDLVGKVVVAAGMVNGVEKLCTDVDPLGIESQRASEHNALELSKESHEVELQALVKSVGVPENKTVLEIGALADGVVPVGNAKSWSPPQWPISDANVSEGTGPKNKFPRRRVSATRDFPPFCGRNAPRPTEEDRLRIISGNKSLGGTENASGTENSGVESRALGGISRGGVESGAGVEGGPLRETVRTGVEELTGGARDGNSEKSELKAIVIEPTNKSLTVIKKGNEDIRGSVGKVGKEIVVYPRDKSDKRRPSVDAVGLGCELNRVIMQGLMAAPNCPWRQGKGALTGPDGVMSISKVKKLDFTGQGKPKPVTRTINYEANYSRGKSMKEKSVFAGKAAHGSIVALNVRDEEDCVALNEEQREDSPAGQTPHDFDVSLPPFGPNSSSHGDARSRVRETLRLFQAICRKILQGDEAKLRQQGNLSRRIDLQAAKIVKEKGKEVNIGKQIVGAVPGVEVGDEFQYRVELAIIGVHRLYQAGIDYMKHGGVIIAASIVASGGYADDLDNADVLIYSGQGGNLVGKDKQPEDQKLERGNLALKNSISVKNPVRVIRGSKETKASDSLDTRAKIVTTYVYDGLYTVVDCRTDAGPHGKLVFKFELRRIPGQPDLAWKEVKKSKKFKIREGLCVDDISGRKELFPICAVNTIDNEKPPPFNYITRMIYPDWYRPIPPKGCDCTGRCSDSHKCSCAVKNGGEIPYNYNGAIVEAKPLVYECGPTCKCPPSCYNRVSQHGIKIQLEIFKTESRGWGVRSLTSISSGSFICEYTGELLKDKEAEQRTGNDEYLFDIGQNYSVCSLKPDAQSSLSEIVEDGGYTIDAAQYGNVGRFINHSCSPNLYAQNVLYDHEDKRMPHIMLFAAENIPPLQELTYHYNYSVDEIRDSDGNIKMKSCYCGSTECTGRMY